MHYNLPWEQIKGEAATRLEQELQLEVHANHLLWEKQTRAIAQRVDRDDVLFEITDQGQQSYAVVHLTWKRGKEFGPYPGTEVYDDFDKFVKQNMEPNAKWYAEEVLSNRQ